MLVQSSPYRKLQSLVATLLLLLLAAAAFSQPAPRAAEQVAAVQEPAVAEPQVPVAEPATLVTGPVSSVAEPAPTTVPDSARPTLVPAPPLAVTIDAAASPAAAVLAQLDAAAIDAFAPDAGAGIMVAAGATDEPQVAPAAAYADLTAIAQLADEIAAIKAEKIRYVAEWNSIAAECDAGSHRPFGNLISPCRKTRLALRSGEVLQFGLECYDLAYRHTALLDSYATTASQQAAEHVQGALQANERSLTEFCSRETWRTAYPAFAALFEDAKAPEYRRGRIPPIGADRYASGATATWDSGLASGGGGAPIMAWDGSAAIPIP